MSEPSRPVPVPTPESRPYWEACNRGELLVQRCDNCGEVNWFPRGLCRACSSDRLRWDRSAGSGRVYSFTVVYRPPFSGLPVPYVVALVDVDGGPRMMTHIVGCAPEEVTVGMAVSVRFDWLTSEAALPVFGPEESA
jgi:uncharacterized OB-fold protein